MSHFCIFVIIPVYNIVAFIYGILNCHIYQRSLDLNISVLTLLVSYDLMLRNVKESYISKIPRFKHFGIDYSLC